MNDQEFTDTQYDEIRKLHLLTKEFPCFEFDGMLIKGNVIEVIKKYLKENPSKKFRTWLLDNNFVIIEQLDNS